MVFLIAVCRLHVEKKDITRFAQCWSGWHLLSCDVFLQTGDVRVEGRSAIKIATLSLRLVAIVFLLQKTAAQNTKDGSGVFGKTSSSHGGTRLNSRAVATVGYDRTSAS